MTAAMLRLCDGIDFPLSMVTEPVGIFGQRGYGKTWTAVDLVEELYAAGLPSVILDIKGDWWGIRSSVDGKRDGLPFLIIGGDHADVPLEHGGGRAIARFIAERNVPAVIDLSELSKTKARQWAMEFAEELYDLKRRLRSPLMLVVDEADVLIPQRLSADLMRLLGAMEDIAKRGRQRGLGICVVTQRVADVNKSVTDLLTTLIVHAVTGVRTRKALMEWIDDHARDADSVHDVLSSLSGLEPGEAWVWSPGFLRLLKRVRMRRITTYDSHATPEPGQQIEMPRRMADIDVSSLSAELAEAIERAKADDPAELRKQIAALERRLAERPAAEPPEPVRVEVSVLTDEERAALARTSSSVEGLLAGLQHAVTELGKYGQEVMSAIDGATARFEARRAVELAASHARPSVPAARTVTSTPPARAKATVTQHEKPPRAAGRTERTSPTPAGSNGGLKQAERALLAALCQRSPLNYVQLGILSGYSHTSSHFDNTVSALRTAGLVEGTRSGLSPTRAGRAAMGRVAPIDEQAMLEVVLGRLKQAERILFRCLLEAWPDSLDYPALGERSGYSAGSSHFDNSVSRLRKLDLINGSRSALTARDEFGKAFRG